MATTNPPGAAGAGTSAALRGIAAVDALVDRIGRAAAWLTMAIALLMAVDVLLRYAFSIGSVWAQELEWHLLSPLVLFGMTYALQKGDHVRVDVLYARYSPRWQAAVDLLGAVLAVAVAVLVVRYSLAYVGQSYAIGEISADPGGLTHRWMLKALIPIGFALFAVQALAQGVDALLRVSGAVPAARQAGDA
ncbi:TRAP transporter small permease subunit [Variovorax sp.]|uniref:TRAP transporter small permease subunit n=1 Tax=Variovorax sp. TaxID=1871043 RepID=UPI002D658E69|nr:TRAP transporter small permease subunit [Variovorax sp.]HYP82415.1 TRAP transporter small permease subunit [Variovorax sp.]